MGRMAVVAVTRIDCMARLVLTNRTKVDLMRIDTTLTSNTTRQSLTISLGECQHLRFVCDCVLQSTCMPLSSRAESPVPPITSRVLRFST